MWEAHTLQRVHLTRLQLSNFRSWTDLTFDLGPGITLVSGPNAAGKSNLIEAMYMLASLRSTRAQTEGELIRWDAESPQVMRIAALARTKSESVEVDIALSARSGANAGAARQRSGAPLTSKRIRINGVARRASEALGAIRAVQFTTLDLDMLTGSSAVRRRYLDVAVGQIQRSHAANLSRYQRALAQRNALLKRIADGQAAETELAQWDELLQASATPIWEARAEAAASLAEFAAHRHLALRSPDDEAEVLALTYAPGDAQTLRESRRRDLARGTTSVGPHRDELLIDLDGRPAANFASRAQQRVAALSMRLAEADFLADHSADSAILLLDDVFSELDPARRVRTAEAVAEVEQVVLTTAEPLGVPFSPTELAASYDIVEGSMRPDQ